MRKYEIVANQFEASWDDSFSLSYGPYDTAGAAGEALAMIEVADGGKNQEYTIAPVYDLAECLERFPNRWAIRAGEGCDWRVRQFSADPSMYQGYFSFAPHGGTGSKTADSLAELATALDYQGTPAGFELCEWRVERMGS